jgi:glucose-6-phosphate 1-dehydrogenase
MDVPDRIDSLGIRNEKVKVFRNLQLDPDFTKDIVFGQYE